MTEQIFLHLTHSALPYAILSILCELVVARATKPNKVPIFRDRRIVVYVMVVEFIGGALKPSAQGTAIDSFGSEQ